MKNYFTRILGFLLLFSILQSYGQISTKIESNLVIDSGLRKIKFKQNKSGLACIPNRFYQLLSNGQILQFTLINNQVRFDTVIMSGALSNSLAVCANLNGGNYSPTFYGSKDTLNGNNGAIPTYFDGSSWITIPTGVNNINCACIGNHLYYYSSGNPRNQIHRKINRFDGTNFTTVYNDRSKRIVSADLAMDSMGSIYFAIKILNSLAQPPVSDSIRVLSSSGQQLTSYPLSIDFTDSYGAFFMNQKLYYGFGATNPTYPNSLLPISFSNNSVIIGTPIPMPIPPSPYRGLDMASCNMNLITALPHITDESRLKLYPNPNTGSFKLSYGIKNQIFSIYIFDITGRIVFQNEFNKGNIELNLELPKGLYMVNIHNSDSRLESKSLLIE